MKACEEGPLDERESVNSTCTSHLHNYAEDIKYKIIDTINMPCLHTPITQSCG